MGRQLRAPAGWYIDSMSPSGLSLGAVALQSRLGAASKAWAHNAPQVLDATVRSRTGETTNRALAIIRAFQSLRDQVCVEEGEMISAEGDERRPVLEFKFWQFETKINCQPLFGSGVTRAGTSCEAPECGFL